MEEGSEASGGGYHGVEEADDEDAEESEEEEEEGGVADVEGDSDKRGRVKTLAHPGLPPTGM